MTHDRTGAAMVKRDVAFIGVGRMGGRMARRIVAAGHTVRVFDPDRDAVDALAASGARAAESPAQAAAGASIVLCSLPGPSAVEQALLGDAGVIEGTQADAL